MNKPIRTVALLAALSLAAVGCQKESIADLNPKTATSETAGTVYTVCYAIDGVAHQATLRGDEAHSAFILRMLTLAEQGHEVSFYDADQYSPDAATREVVTYSTQKKEEAYSWAIQMEEEGYRVKVSYDEKTNTFNCVAYR